MRKAKFSTFTQIQVQNILWNLLLFLSCPPSRMYETSCTCEILHWTPHVHRLKLWTGSPTPAASWTFFFLPFGTQWFWALYLCMLDPADTYCALFKPEETVYRFLMFLSTYVRKIQHLKKKKLHLFIQVRYKIQRERQHEVERVKKEEKKKETSNNVLVLLTYRTLVCCSVKLTAVECYLFIWIYFYEVCYWSELHIYFVNHEMSMLQICVF